LKIIIENISESEEEQVIFKVHEMNEETLALIGKLKQAEKKELLGMKDKKNYRLLFENILYFEAVDKKTFAYTVTDVFEVREKLYQLEELLKHKIFLRISKSMILNLQMIVSVYPTLSGRFEAELENGERIKISRQYVPKLKQKLGMEGAGA
jgi:DNA-binding LytR/AlgR family response regulator